MTISRRGFLQGAAAAIGGVTLFHVVPRHVLGGPGNIAPSETILRGVIGTGEQGMTHVTGAQGKGVRTLAVCDVDSQHLARAKAKAGGACEAYSDWRKVIDRKDLDTIHVGTPPHWHALISMAAMQAGKDVYSEKPMTKYLREGTALIETVRRYSRVYSINSYGRDSHRGMKKLIDSGLLGWPLTVLVSAETGNGFKVAAWSGHTSDPPEPVPQQLDYDMWLGPAPFKPYFRHRTHMSFRGYWDYDGGGLADMGQHWLDRIQWALGKDNDSPVEVEAYAPFPAHPDAVGMWGSVTMKYADGTTLLLESLEWGDKKSPKDPPYIVGPKGKAWGGDGKITRTDPPEIMEKLKSYPEPGKLVDFDECVKTRQDPQQHPCVEAAHHSITLIHLANCAIRTGRKLKFDPGKQAFAGDDEANRMLDVPMRAPWHLP
jgi:myo-inositol 2-dehydrogenase / D-chiro-inositol 1-dehydrogenase